jgi:hypothetical protein
LLSFWAIVAVVAIAIAVTLEESSSPLAQNQASSTHHNLATAMILLQLPQQATRPSAEAARHRFCGLQAVLGWSILISKALKITRWDAIDADEFSAITLSGAARASLPNLDCNPTRSIRDIMPTKTCNFDHAALMPTSLF